MMSHAPGTAGEKGNVFLERWAAICSGKGEDAAIFHPDGSVARTFAAMDREADEWAAKFEGTRTVALAFGNDVAMPGILLGAWKAGSCVALLEAGDDPLRTARIQEICGIEINVGMSFACTRTEISVCPELRAGTVLLKLTSGTTGDPRAICFSADQLFADTRAICETMGIDERDRNYGVISFSHSYGFSNLITPLIAYGIPLVAATDKMPRSIIEGMNAGRATVLPGVPAIFRALASMDCEVPSLRLCISAGAPLPGAVAREFHSRWGRKVHSFYGASECGGICYDASGGVEIPEGYVGTPMSGVSISLIDEAGPSQIAVKSGAVGLGFYPEDANSGIRGGTFVPSDLIRRHGEGFVIAGRMSDLINMAGRKVNPAAVESALRELPGVAEVVVFGIASEARGEDVAACLAGDVTEEQARTFCATRLPAWQMPRKWFFLPEIPTNSRGKVSRAELRKLLNP